MTIGYIDLPISTDSDVIMQDAIANISDAIPGWIPRRGNMEVLILEQMAFAAAEAAATAATVPPSIFIQFGSLVGITPLLGNSETIQVLLTLVSPAAGSPGYQIPAATQFGFSFSGGSYVFETINDALIATGLQSVSLTLQAVTAGSAYNLDALASSSLLNLTGLQLQRLNPDPLISSVTLTATPATNTSLVVGTDPESETAFLNRLAAELQLLAPRPITSSDYALFSQNVSGIYRALAFDGINPFSNLFSASNANWTTAPTSGSAPTGWTGIGDGVNLSSLSTPGTSPANYLQVSTASSALMTAAALQTATVVGATTATVTTGTGPAISTSVSPTNPAIIMFIDGTNGHEAAVVIGAAATTGSGASTKQVLTLASGLQIAHPITTSINTLQGAKAPLVGAAPGANGVVATNSAYYLASTVVECGSDTTATARPLVVALATYLDGSTLTLSSEPSLTSRLFDYTSAAKTIFAAIPTSNVLSTSYLASTAVAPYSTLKPSLCSVQMYIVWDTVGTSKTHYVLYDNVSAAPFDFSSVDSPTISTSNWNFLPDANLASFFFPNSALGSWTLPAGVVALPGYGIQYQGSGSALASPLTAISQVFNLSNRATDLGAATSRSYTAFATIDASYTGSTYNDITFEVYDMSTGAVLNTGSAISASPSSAGIANILLPFTLTTAKDVEIRIVFGTGLNVPLNSSVVVSNIGVVGGTLTNFSVITNNDLGYSWTPGGLYSTQVFNYPRMISICPIDVNGLPIVDAIKYQLALYLSSKREVNFVTNIINPTYFPIDVQWSAYVQNGYSAATVQAEVNAAIQEFLNPASWAGGSNSPPYWDGSALTVRVFDIASVMSSVQGLGSITSVMIRPSYPLNGTFAVTDINMIGVAPLPIANIINSTTLEAPNAQFSGLS